MSAAASPNPHGPLPAFTIHPSYKLPGPRTYTPAPFAPPPPPPPFAPAAGALSSSQLASFRSRGYLVVPLLSPPEVSSARAALRAAVLGRSRALCPPSPPPAAAGAFRWESRGPAPAAFPGAATPSERAAALSRRSSAAAAAHGEQELRSLLAPPSPSAPLPPYLDLSLLLSSPAPSLPPYVRATYPPLTSTGGAGGVLDVHYSHALDQRRTDGRLLAVARALFGGTYGEPRPEEAFRLPEGFPGVDFGKVYSSHDRVCVRLPDAINGVAAGAGKGERRRGACSRGLGPHLDCCPETAHASVREDHARLRALRRGEAAAAARVGRGAARLGGCEPGEARGALEEIYDGTRVLHPGMPGREGMSEAEMREGIRGANEGGGGRLGEPPCGKWRPVQCFLSLTDTLEPETGGIEIAPGRHRTFESWAKKGGGGLEEERACAGPFTAIRDADICAELEHVPVPAGSAIFWDYRLPHATARAHKGEDLRLGLYVSLLPKTLVNERVVQYERACRNAGVV
ncbi:hypothetical protein TeGR_g6071, partial [Tetraparma gracilis]